MRSQIKRKARENCTDYCIGRKYLLTAIKSSKPQQYLRYTHWKEKDWLILITHYSLSRPLARNWSKFLTWKDSEFPILQSSQRQKLRLRSTCHLSRINKKKLQTGLRYETLVLLNINISIVNTLVPQDFKAYIKAQMGENNIVRMTKRREKIEVILEFPKLFKE